MKLKFTKVVLIVALLVIFGIGSSMLFLEPETVEGTDDPPEVVVSAYPLYEMANRIAGDRIDIDVVIPHGAEAHGYRPSPRKIAQLERTDAFFYIGLGFEPWADQAVENLQGTDVETIRVSDVANLRKFGDAHDNDHHDDGHCQEEEHHHEDENHHDEHSHAYEDEHHHDHDHTGYDPHIWLDPMNMQQIVDRMREAFAKLDPAGEEFYNNRYQEVVEKLAELDKVYEETLAETDKEHIIVSHAAFGYLADKYGFEQLAVTGIAPHQEPSPGTIAELTKKANEYNLEYVFMEVLASPRIVEILAEEADLEVLTLNPIEGLTTEQLEAGEDYFSIMYENLDNLEEALK